MRYLGGGGQTGDFMSSFIRIPTFESFNLSFIKFLNSAELVRDTCIKTWIQDTQSSELPKNISICSFCAVHEAGVSVVENHDQSAILSVSSVAAVLHYECGRSAAPLQPQSAWPGYSSTVLGNVILLFTFTMVAPESLKCKKYLRQNRNLPLSGAGDGAGSWCYLAVPRARTSDPSLAPILDIYWALSTRK